jgi:hypothetical protein
VCSALQCLHVISPMPEFNVAIADALRAARFQPRNPATIKLTHYRKDLPVLEFLSVPRPFRDGLPAGAAIGLSRTKPSPTMDTLGVTEREPPK